MAHTLFFLRAAHRHQVVELPAKFAEAAAEYAREVASIAQLLRCQYLYLSASKASKGGEHRAAPQVSGLELLVYEALSY